MTGHYKWCLNTDGSWTFIKAMPLALLIMNSSTFCLKTVFCWAWWLMPVILALLDAGVSKVGRLLEPRSLRPAWATWWNPVFTKNTKISLVWWQVPVVLATQEAEWENHLSPGGWGCSEARLWHCTPAWVTESDPVSKKKKKKEKQKNKTKIL